MTNNNNTQRDLNINKVENINLNYNENDAENLYFNDLFKKNIFFTLSRFHKKNEPQNHIIHSIASTFFQYYKEPYFNFILKSSPQFDNKARLANLNNFAIITVINEHLFRSENFNLQNHKLGTQYLLST